MTTAGPRAAVPLPTGPLLRRYARERRTADLELLVERFRPLARKLALRYARHGEPVDDLEQIAGLGLVKALQRFDPDRGNAFSSFAVPTILGELKRSFRTSAWAAHVPRSLQEHAALVRTATERLANQMGRPPTIPEVADVARLSEEEVLEALRVTAARDALSFDAPTGSSDPDDDGDDLLRRLGHFDDGYERAEDLDAIAVASRALTDTQRRVLAMRFAEDLMQTEIAARLGVSQMQISRIQRSALDRLAIMAAHQSRPAPPTQDAA